MPRPDDPGRDARTYSVLLALLFLAGLLVFFFALVLPQFLVVFLVVGGFIGMIGLQYLIWGWWLSELLSKPDEPPSEQP
ncbi:hypothetical protein GC163_10965 [bacterium]|nr:hypothetical protein [bacterium]